MQKIELSNLDALRSVAIITVLIDHLIPTLHAQLGIGSPFLLAFTAHIGQAGVLAFFVHTSLVLMMSLERMRAQSNHVTLRFYLRRAFRIYPLAWFCIALVLILGLPSNTWRNTDPVTPLGIAANLALVQNIWPKKQVLGPLWSLAYEMQMYLVLPLLFALIIKKNGRLLMFSLILLFCAAGYALAQRTGGKLNMAAYLPCFVAGVWSFGLLKKIKPAIRHTYWLPFVIGMVCLYAWFQRIELEPVYWEGWIYCTLLALAIPLFQNIQYRKLALVCQQIAKYSYGLYLLHVPVLYFIFIWLKVSNALWGSALFFFLTTISSILLYHLIEDPLIEMGRRFSEKNPTDQKATPENILRKA